MSDYPYLRRMRLLFPLLLLLFSCVTRRSVGSTTPPDDAAATQAELSATYLDPERTILTATKRERLQELGGLTFYPISPDYRVEATVSRYADPEIIQMPTSSGRIVAYRIFGQASFTLDGQPVTLDLLETTNPNVPLEYQGLLFVPFRDATSGTETYGGGRYLDVPTPEGNTVILDFNKAYHPYCAYSDGYSCPVPPEQNTLPVAVRAGIRNTDLGED